MSLTAWIGLALMTGSEVATLAHLEPFWSWTTPIAWTGFILFADSIVWRARGNSWMRSNGREFALLAIASIPLWLVFEGYNRVIGNWYYTGLPEDFALRMFGYAWSFATIWPAIFEGAELAAVWRAGTTGKARTETAFSALDPPALPALPALPAFSIATGALMLACPFLVPAAVARYMAAPVWLGFIFLLEPINTWLGGESLFLAQGQARPQLERVTNLALSGLLCGVLWEFWNYWSRAKWHYSVPIMEHTKLFEMPFPGYLGFPAFALECFTMYVFARTVFTYLMSGFPGLREGQGSPTTKLGRTIAL